MNFRAPIFFAFFIICQFSYGQETQFLTQIGEEDSLYSEVFKEQKTFWVQMPMDFQEGNEIDYPVIFVLDGGVMLPQLSSILQAESPGFIPEMIIVGISNRVNRTRDLTPTEVDVPYIPASGGASLFSEFLLSELIPYIDEKYPTTPYRTLIGHSYAGLFTLNMMLNNTNKFRNYLVIDPSLDWDNQKFFNRLIDEIGDLDYYKTTLFLGIANEIPRFSDELTLETVVDDLTDFSLNIRSNLALASMLDHTDIEGLRFGWKYYEEELHGTLPLINMFDGLKWLFDWYPIKSPSKFNDPGTPIDELISMIEGRTALLSAHFGYPVYGFPEDLLDMLGHMNLDMGMSEKSFKFFELSKKYFPESYSVYESMADYYLTEKLYEKALQEMEHAYKLNETDVIRIKIEEIKLKLKN